MNQGSSGYAYTHLKIHRVIGEPCVVHGNILQIITWVGRRLEKKNQKLVDLNSVLCARGSQLRVRGQPLKERADRDDGGGQGLKISSVYPFCCCGLQSD